jgi:hypothetical protein
MNVTGVPPVATATVPGTPGRPQSVLSATYFVDSSLNEAAPSYQTPALLASGRGSYTASSDGLIADCAQTVIPDTVPSGRDPGANGKDPAEARLLRISNELMRQSILQDAANESRLICR